MKTYNTKIVKAAMIDQINKYVPNYQFDQLTYDIIDYAFGQTAQEYTEDEANALLRSIIEQKMMRGEIGGHMTPFEKAIWFYKDKNKHPYKHNAEMGCGEFWTYFINNWKFSQHRGVDVETESGIGVDIKAASKDDSIADIPGTFYDVNGNPITKIRGNIFYLGEKVYTKKSKDYKGMYRALWAIKSFKINYEDLGFYIYYHLNGDKLEYVVKDKLAVQNDVNRKLVDLKPNMGIDSRINLTHSFFEDGSFIYNYPQFGAI